MTWPIDVQALEQAIVRNCSPTLAALKPASLFTFPGSFTAQAPESQNEASARRQALLEAVKYCQRQVSNAGVAIRILAWKRCGALVYVYRPRELAAYLVDQRAAHPLENEGYRPGDLDACLDELSRRLQNRSSAERQNKAPNKAQNKRAMKASPVPAAIAFAEVSSRTKSAFSWAIPTKT